MAQFHRLTTTTESDESQAAKFIGTSVFWNIWKKRLGHIDDYPVEALVAASTLHNHPHPKFQHHCFTTNVFWEMELTQTLGLLIWVIKAFRSLYKDDGKPPLTPCNYRKPRIHSHIPQLPPCNLVISLALSAKILSFVVQIWLYMWQHTLPSTHSTIYPTLLYTLLYTYYKLYYIFVYSSIQN